MERKPYPQVFNTEDAGRTFELDLDHLVFTGRPESSLVTVHNNGSKRIVDTEIDDDYDGDMGFHKAAETSPQWRRGYKVKHEE